MTRPIIHPGVGSGNYPHKREIPANSHPLVRLLFAEMMRQGISNEHLAHKSGVSHNAINNMRKTTPRVVLLEAVLNAIGFDLVAIKRKP